MSRSITLLALAFSLALAPEALAGKKPAAESGAEAAKDPYAVPEIKPTKIAEFDTLFEKARVPVTSLAATRKQVDEAQKRMNTAVGLGADATFAAALTELKTKVETKGTLAYKKGKVPTFTTADAMPDDVQKMIDESNAAMGDFGAAFTQLESIQVELAALATETAELPGKVPAAAKASGLKPTEIPGATTATKNNAGVVGDGKDQATKLMASLNGIVSTVESTLTAAPE